MTKIAFSGAQISGKTTLCFGLMNILKINNINAGYVPEAARSSMYLFKGDRGIEMHLESLMRHITNELIYSDFHDVLICDRSCIDFLAYAYCRFSEKEVENNPILKSVKDLSLNYVKTYDMIYVIPPINMENNNDRLRNSENTEQTNVYETIIETYKKNNLSYKEINDRSPDKIYREIKGYL